MQHTPAVYGGILQDPPKKPHADLQQAARRIVLLNSHGLLLHARPGPPSLPASIPIVQRRQGNFPLFNRQCQCFDVAAQASTRLLTELLRGAGCY